MGWFGTKNKKPESEEPKEWKPQVIDNQAPPKYDRKSSEPNSQEVEEEAITLTDPEEVQERPKLKDNRKPQQLKQTHPDQKSAILTNTYIDASGAVFTEQALYQDRGLIRVALYRQQAGEDKQSTPILGARILNRDIPDLSKKVENLKASGNVTAENLVSLLRSYQCDARVLPEQTHIHYLSFTYGKAFFERSRKLEHYKEPISLGK